MVFLANKKSFIFWDLGSLYSAKAKLPISIHASVGLLIIIAGLIVASICFSLGDYHLKIEISDIAGKTLVASDYVILNNQR
jgi:hypothetical protein